MASRALIVLVLSLWAAQGRAQTTQPVSCDPDDPKKCSTGLLAGQAAPYAGQLLTPKLAIELGQKATYCDERLKLELDRVTGLAVVQKELDLKLLTIERDAAREKVAALQKALDATADLEEPPPWWERPPVVAVVTVLATTAVLVLAVKTVQWTTPE